MGGGRGILPAALTRIVGISASLAAVTFSLGLLVASAGGQAGSGLNRPDEPIVIQQTQAADNGSATGPINVSLPGTLLGIVPGDLVAFRWEDGWQQIPVQVDEREVRDLNDIYGPGYPSCSDPCYSKPPNGARHRIFTDPDTWVGPDTDATLDADDEVSLMASDAGAEAASTFAPAGVHPESGTEVRVTDPLDSGAVGFVYLFEDAGGLDPAAGRDYVVYDFQLADGKDYKDPTGSYKPTTTAAPSMARGPRPESSQVTTPSYVRGFTDRWKDDELRITRGGASGVDILDRHDAQFDALDASCVRTQATYASGEGAFVTNRDGPVRAIRDFIGANSGPHVQRQHVFYASKEVINTYLRVHPVPGVTDFFDYSEAGIGLEYSNGVQDIGAVNTDITIDGTPDPVIPFGGSSGVDGWEAVDGPQGGVTMPQSFVTNNADPTYHGNYRDLADPPNEPCNGDDKLLGASGPQGNTAFENTDEAGRNQWGGGRFSYLYYKRAMYYEEPGQADGVARLAEEQNPLQLELSDAGLTAEPQNQPPVASFSFSPESPQAGEEVTFTSDSTDPDGTIADEDVLWDLDDDGEFDDATGPTASRSFDASGDHEVHLKVSDDDGATDTTFRTVAVESPPPNIPPTAAFEFTPDSPVTGEQVEFDGGGSSDEDGSISTYEWDLNGDGDFSDPEDATGAGASRTFAAAGPHQVTLRVTDDDGDSDTSTRTVTVSEPPNEGPTAAFEFTPASPSEGQQVEFDSSGSADADGTIESYAWDLNGDGVLNDSDQANPSRAFPAGTHEVTLRVTDDDGATDDLTRELTVTPVAGGPGDETGQQPPAGAPPKKPKKSKRCKRKKGPAKVKGGPKRARKCGRKPGKKKRR